MNVYSAGNPILHAAYYCMLLAVLIREAILVPLPFHSTESEILEYIVKQAVNTSLSGDHSSRNHNLISSLTYNLIEILDSYGVELAYRQGRCRHQSSETLQQLFLQSMNPDCISLAKLLVPGENGKEEVFMITTNSSCSTELRMDSQCFPIGKEAYCSTSTHIQYLDLGEDYFPQFVVSVQCGGCKSNDTECLDLNNRCWYRNHSVEYSLLKRVPDECDENGRELWEVEPGNEVNVGCSCMQFT